MCERAIAMLSHAALAIIAVGFFWGATVLVVEAMPELQTLQATQIDHFHRSN